MMDAEKELNSLILAYQLAVITESMEVGTVSNIEGDRTLSLTQKQQRLQSAISTVDAAQAEYDAATLQVASVNKELGYIGNQVVDTTNEKNAVSNAQKEANSASQSVANAQVEVSKAATSVETAERELEKAKTTAVEIQEAGDNLNVAKGTLDNLQTNYDSMVLEAEKAVEDANSTLQGIEAEYESIKLSYDMAKTDYDQWMKDNESTATLEQISEKSEALEKVKTAFNNAELKKKKQK